MCIRDRSIDEVDADIPEAGLAEAVYGCDGLRGIVPAVPQFQGGGVECLSPHASAVEGEGAQHGHCLLYTSQFRADTSIVYYQY